jgi:hypothetical protein
MGLLVRLLSTLAGVIFTIGAPAESSAQEFRSAALSTAVIARQKPSMNSYEMERKRFLTVLAAQPGNPPPGNPPPGNPPPGNPPPDTKPTKKTKSPKKYLP